MNFRSSLIAAATFAAAASAPVLAHADYFPTCQALEKQCEERAQFYSKVNATGPLTESSCATAYTAAEASGYWNSPMKGAPTMTCKK